MRARVGHAGGHSRRQRHPPGRQIDADYRILKRIGGGSFGDVFLAEERKSGTKVGSTRGFVGGCIVLLRACLHVVPCVRAMVCVVSGSFFVCGL